VSYKTDPAGNAGGRIALRCDHVALLAQQAPHAPLVRLALQKGRAGAMTLTYSDT
jgi:hypothetical protein